MLTDRVKIAAIDPRPLAELIHIARCGVAEIRERNNRKAAPLRTYPDVALFLVPHAQRTYPPSYVE